jgi:predicted peptidase
MQRKLKRTISAALACMLLLALLPAGALAASWENHWSAPYVQTAVDNGWIDADQVDPGKTVTRAEAAALLEKATGYTDSAAQDADSLLTRQSAIQMLADAFGLKVSDPSAAAGYADWADVADGAKDAVAAAVEQGIVNGVGGNKLAPNANITLGELLKLAAVTDEKAAPSAIQRVSTIGFVDNDGAKVATIVVEYASDLTGADVSLDTFRVDDYGISQGNDACEIGSDPGVPTKVYVNDAPEASENGGSGSGNYVIIEVNTDYQMGSVASSYKTAMYAGVRQVGDITTGSGVIPGSVKEVVNYTVVEEEGRNGVEYNKYANDDGYSIPELDKFQLFTKEDGTAFHATNCFEEATGEYVDVDLPYALYVPEDYDPSQKYALILQIHDAGFMGNDPMITLTESQGCVNFASDEAQQIIKDQGLAGLIVVAPQFEDSIRTTRDNYSTSAGVPATWQLLDYLTETYNIDMDHIYGTGQSMGGMQVVAMAAQRDNYFAGIWANGCQWGNNYQLDAPYADREGTAVYYEAPADGTIIWTQDADGNEVDYRNWYYMISDDNVLITNCTGDKFSTTVWTELAYLYSDLAGVTIPKVTFNPITDSQEDQEAAVTALLTGDSDTGFYWTAMDGGNHMATWIYSHGVWAHTQWLLSQTRQTENDRDKLDLDKPFVRAAEQDTSAEREINGSGAYFVTGEYGSGTADYNSGLFGMQGTPSEGREPGWTYTADEAGE